MLKKKFDFDASLCRVSNLRLEKITEEDLALIRELGLRDWNDREFDERGLVAFCEWVVSEDRSVILMALGGGAFEIPEMYELIYKGERVRMECGGGGSPAWTFGKGYDLVSERTVFVSRIAIPSALSHDRDTVLKVAAEAFAVRSLSFATAGRLTVEFTV